MMLYLAPQETEKSTGGTGAINPLYGISWDTLPDVTDSSGSVIVGGSGIRSMYINKMSAGYYREYLEIIRDHANWSKMHDAVQPVMYKGKPIYPSVPLLLGLILSESGIESEGEPRVSTNSVMSRLWYKNDGKHTLATYNSAVAREDNGKSLARGYMGSLDLYYQEAYDKRTHFQFSAGYAAIYPSGRYTNEATYYPSKMNGYGIAAGTVRTRADTDAAYFPDDISIAIQRAWVAIGRSPHLFDLDSLTETAVETIMYPIYNYGEAGMAYQWGVGTPTNGTEKFSRSGWSSKNTMTFAQNTAGSVNYIDSLIVKVLTTLAENYDLYVKGLWDTGYYPYVNHNDYKGLAIASILLNGGFVTPDRVQNIRNNAEDAGFLRGATLAYRVFKNDPTATTATVKQWLQNPPAKTIPDKYGRYQDTLVHYFDSDYQIYTNDGVGPMPALRSYSSDVRGPFIARIGGVMVYWKMLLASGVECTFGDAYKDAMGLRIEEASSPKAHGSSYYTGGVKFVSFLKNSTTLSRNTSTMTYRDLSFSKGIHYGEDFVARFIDVCAVANGTVSAVGSGAGTGNYVTVDIERQEGEPLMQFAYFHLNKVYVKTGDKVKAGQVIAQSGDTGTGNAPHLHVEIRIYRGNNNQRYYLQFRSIFEGHVTPEYAPALIAGTKTAEGRVYDKNGVLLGTLKDSPHTADAEPYLELGPNRFLKQALAAP